MSKHKHSRGIRPCPHCGGSMRADKKRCDNCERKAVDEALRFQNAEPKAAVPGELLVMSLITSAAARARK